MSPMKFKLISVSRYCILPMQLPKRSPALVLRR
jgi:hypothetical protein